MMHKLLDPDMTNEGLSGRRRPLAGDGGAKASCWQGHTDDADWRKELMRDIRFRVGFPDALFEPPGP